MFSLVFSLPWVIVFVRFILPLPWPWLAKIVLAAILLVASQFHYFSRLSSGSVFSPEFARPLVIAFNIAFGALVLLAVLQLGLDLISIVTIPVFAGFPSVPAEVRYAMGVAALLLSAYGVAQAIRVPPVKNVDIVIDGLPAAFEGYRLLQLTDLHISRLFPAAWTDAVVSRSNDLDVDLIVVTGDFIDGSLASRRNDVEPLSRLRARDGVYGIPGNHEYFFDYRAWMTHLGGLGIRMLENAHTVIHRGDDRLVVAGVTDLSAIGSHLPAPDLALAMAGAPGGAPVILLDHQPGRARRAAEAGVALQLSGHTHGGMVIGLERLVARGNSGFASGLYAVGNMQLYVNNGTGLWPGFALRLGKPSELTVITLRQKI